MDKLEDYSFVKIERNKKDHKSSFVALAVDLKELADEIDKLNAAE